MRALSYTLGEVVDLERPAWHEDDRGETDFVYDGINFWCGRPGVSCDMASTNMLPVVGWRHKDRCRCPSCRAARQRHAS
jgi:hypothetical protein